MRKISLTLALLALTLQALAAGGHKRPPSVEPKDAWRLLSEGNERFARGLALKPHADAERRREVAKGQAPFAVVITCSDSRLTPELIFDQGLGDLFVLRSAGNFTEGDINIGSIEYAVEHLGAHLVLVLGHEKCGAVTAAVKGVKKDDHVKIDELAAKLKPAADEAKDKVGGLKGDDLVAEAIERNVLFQIRNLLKGSPLVADKVGEKEVEVIGGIYSLENGRVRWLGEHPSEKAVIEGKKP
jgi:carbonic anhydrase